MLTEEHQPRKEQVIRKQYRNVDSPCRIWYQHRHKKTGHVAQGECNHVLRIEAQQGCHSHRALRGVTNSSILFSRSLSCERSVPRSNARSPCNGSGFHNTKVVTPASVRVREPFSLRRGSG